MSHTAFHVYVVTCTVDGREYVGMPKDPTRRFYYHTRRGAMREAIAELGEECFHLQVLSTHATKAQAMAEEQAQIRARNTHEPNGFNRRMRGGSYPGCGGAGAGNTNSRRNACAAYYPDGQEAFRFDTVLEASKATGIARNTIHRCFMVPAYTAGGYFWKRVDG